jgi:hypothetical protein
MKQIELITRSLTLGDLQGLPEELPKKRLYRSQPGEEPIEVMSETFNIVMSRNVRKNTRLAAEVAVGIAKNEGSRDVWYINTYAGVNLLKESFEQALGEIPQTGSRQDTLPNLRIMDVPLGEWSTTALAEDIETNGRENAQPVIVLNSFEFASFTRGRGERLARELLKLRNRFGLTVVLFSHEMKRDLQPGLAGRGALGMIAPFATVISPIFDPFEHLMGHMRAENAAIHEEQTHVAQDTAPVHGTETAAKKPEKELTPEEEREIETAIGNIYQKPRPVMGVRLPDVGAKHHKNGSHKARNGSAMAVA